MEGYLLIEAKTNYNQWLEGFYQGLHYQRKFGLVYTTIMVVAHKFVGIWKVKGLPENVIVYTHTADLKKSPSEIGKDLARKTTIALKKEIQAAAFFGLEPKELDKDMFDNAKSLTKEAFQVLKILKNPDSDRLQINSHNFIAAIEQILNGKYPIWANQYDIWSPKLTPEWAQAWYAGCFAFVLAENRCIVTKFAANNPVAGAPEVWVGNPMCPVDRESFWSQVLAGVVAAKPEKPTDLAIATAAVVGKVREIYQVWNMNYCQGPHIEAHCFAAEAYFKYFDYVPFLTPHSGLVQLRKYTELADMGSLFAQLGACTKILREALYQILVGELKYFE